MKNNTQLSCHLIQRRPVNSPAPTKVVFLNKPPSRRILKDRLVWEAGEGLRERREGTRQRWEAWDVSSRFLFTWPQKPSSHVNRIRAPLCDPCSLPFIRMKWWTELLVPTLSFSKSRLRNFPSAIFSCPVVFSFLSLPPFAATVCLT